MPCSTSPVPALPSCISSSFGKPRRLHLRAAFSAGTFEEDRPDASAFEESWLGEVVEGGGEGERWLNITNQVSILRALAQKHH